MTTTVREAPHHRNLTCVKEYRCKRPECMARSRAYQNIRYRKQGYGTWQPFVDAEPIHQHLLNLKAHGMSCAQVAEIAGLYTATVSGFLYDLGPKRPRKRRATPDIAEKILAVSVDQGVPHLIDSTGTRRRLQALARLGWPMKTLGPHIGVHPATAPRLALQARVSADSAKAVKRCYELLRDQNPVEHGVAPGVARKTRNRAEREGWPDPQWWEDYGRIDDPAFDPDEAEAELNFHERAALRREEIIHLAWCGYQPEQILDRLNHEVSISTVRNIVAEWRSGQKRDRSKAVAA
ncbi:hypothetical protein [Streptomyces sp.]|uniref:hypothetical protein n=1 Tax=Streptomyces sp. TaxID=1931 RepID=UPI002812873E|nr:hypothetical protein [Streptomyces sp.]